MQQAFGGKGAHLVLGGTRHVLFGFVDARKDDLAGVHAGFFTNGQLAGAAHLDLVKDVGQSAQQKRIRLDREAKSRFVAEIAVYHGGALFERVQIKDIGRRCQLRRKIR